MFTTISAVGKVCVQYPAWQLEQDTISSKDIHYCDISLDEIALAAWTKLYVGGKGSGRICNNHPWDGMTHFLMNIHELTSNK